MTRVGWLADQHDPPGGAELTQAEFAAVAPDDVEVVWVPPDGLDRLANCDRAAVFNCVTYPPETADALVGKEVTRYFNDLDRHSDPDLRDAFLGGAHCVFTSPLHRERFPYTDGFGCSVIPPALDLQRFRPGRQIRRNGSRAGTISIGAWMNPGKGAHLIEEWAEDNGGVDIAGFGPYAPAETGQTRHLGPIGQAEMPQTLWGYERFVFLPTAVEPFGRAVVEAWAAGCEIITNRLVGARHWIENAPEKLESAAEDFWALVLDG